MVPQPLANGFSDLLAEHLELLPGRAILVGAQTLPDHQLDQQGERQHSPGNAVSPAEQLSQAVRLIVVYRWIAHRLRCGTRWLTDWTPEAWNRCQSAAVEPVCRKAGCPAFHDGEVDRSVSLPAVMAY